MSNIISSRKLKRIFQFHKQGKGYSKRGLARKLQMSRNTLKEYLADMDAFERLFAPAVEDEKAFMNFRFPNVERPIKHQELLKLFPAILERVERGDSFIGEEWVKYKKSIPDGYNESQFRLYFNRWLKSKGITGSPYNRWKIKSLTGDEVAALKKHHRSSSRRKWERAAAILDAYKGLRVEVIAKKLGRTPLALQDWIKIYERSGLDGLFNKKRKPNPAIVEHIKEKKANVIKLIHQTPNLHGINRASWSLATLAQAYQKEYGESISSTVISEYIRAEGFSFKMAKETLTSPDPLYKEKLQAITAILSSLGDRERFFSVDEYGPFAVKRKGGRSLVKNGETPTYPQFQKSKGCLICTAALELSTNQVTHFYSTKKDTEEMIKLLEVLLKEYAGQDRIYFSWDAASWHASKKLHQRIKEVNEPGYRAANNSPVVELAPLPSSAQFLNVIESVFSGMAKAIIHNSDYQSAAECKLAIDRYFAERNAYFKQHPKRAGNKIWGKERVIPVFSETNNCKGQSWS